MADKGIRVVVDVKQSEAIQAQLAKLKAPGINAPMRRFLLKAGYRVLKNAAEQQIIRGGRVRVAGPRGGKGKLTDTPPHPSRLTSRSGELRRSLSQNRGADRSGLPRYIDVGSDLAYAPVHELGLGRYPKRAFLAPAVEAEAPTFEALLYDELEAELEKGGS